MFLKAGFLELGFIEDPDIAFGWYIKSPLIYNTSPPEGGEFFRTREETGLFIL